MQSYLGRFRDVELKVWLFSAMGATGKAAGIGIDSNKNPGNKEKKVQKKKGMRKKRLYPESHQTIRPAISRSGKFQRNGFFFSRTSDRLIW